MDRYRNEWMDNKEQLIEGKKKNVLMNRGKGTNRKTQRFMDDHLWA